MVREQLLNALPSDLKIWGSELKSKTSTEAADMADNYVRARKQERDPELKRESRREGMGVKPRSRGQRDSERRSGLPSTVPRARGENILRAERRCWIRRGSHASIVARRDTYRGYVLIMF